MTKPLPLIPTSSEPERTPTRYDLARWLFDRLEAGYGRCASRDEALGLMMQIMTVCSPELCDPPGPKKAEKPMAGF